VTRRRKRGKPARWPWRSRLDVVVFFPAVGISGFPFLFLFFWRFSCAFLSCYPSTPAPSPPPTIPSTSPSTSPPHQTLSTPAPFPPLISPSPFARLPYLDIHHSSTNFLFPPPSFFLSRALLQPLRYLERPHSTRQRPHITSDSHIWISRRQSRQKVGIGIVISDVF